MKRFALIVCLLVGTVALAPTAALAQNSWGAAVQSRGLSLTNRAAGLANRAQRGIARMRNGASLLSRRIQRPFYHAAGHIAQARANGLGARGADMQERAEQRLAGASALFAHARAQLTETVPGMRVEAQEARDNAEANRDQGHTEIATGRSTSLFHRLNPFSRQGRVARALIRQGRQHLRDAREWDAHSAGIDQQANALELDAHATRQVARNAALEGRAMREQAHGIYDAAAASAARASELRSFR